MKSINARLLSRIRRRIVEDGDCWNWTGAFRKKTIPVISFDGKKGAVRRFILDDLGIDSAHRHLATHTCDNFRCVNPDHVAAMTRKTVARRAYPQANDLLRRRKLADAARKRSKITMEIAQKIREAQGLYREVAARFDVTYGVVARIRRGETWNSLDNPFIQLLNPGWKRQP